MATSKKQLLTSMFLLYWQYDTLPDFIEDEQTGEVTTSEENSVEALVLEVYEDLKQSALAAYPWRSTIKYETLTLSAPLNGTGDEKYSYSAEVPDDFLVMNGFWKDTERNNQCHNEVEMVGRNVRSNLTSVTMSYISDTDEEDLDMWVIDWIKIYIAAEAADIGGQSADRKQLLMQKKLTDFTELSNKDYEMAHKEDISDSTKQFLIY